MVFGLSRRLFVSFVAQPLLLYPMLCCRQSVAMRQALKLGHSVNTSASQATMLQKNPRGNKRKGNSY